MKPSELIELGWAQGDLACDKDGRGVPANNPNAICWCPLGAIIKSVNDDARFTFTRALRKKVGGSICCWNDDKKRTKREVVEALQQTEKQMEELFNLVDLYK